MELIIGSHVKFNKETQLFGSVKEALMYGANTFMFYTGPSQSTMRYPLSDELTYEGYKLIAENNINPDDVIVHSPYIINLGNNTDIRKYEFYIDFLTSELERVKSLGFNKIVLHPGSSVNTTRDEAIRSIAHAINIAYKNVDGVSILLEFMAGKGNEVGSSIDEIKSIIDLVEDKDRINVCIDTCHLNDSGVDLNNFDSFLDEFDSKIGISKIKCVHVNDSMNPIGSHKDRHENIGYGTIGFDTLINIIYNKRLEGIPFILETPYVNRNTNDEFPPYKYEIENIRNKKFNSFK